MGNDIKHMKTDKVKVLKSLRNMVFEIDYIRISSTKEGTKEGKALQVAIDKLREAIINLK